MLGDQKSGNNIISTHALTEGDFFLCCFTNSTGNFNSRPHGGRHEPRKGKNEKNISTHALTEGDDDLLPIRTFPLIFQLTPSRRATS